MTLDNTHTLILNLKANINIYVIYAIINMHIHIYDRTYIYTH